MTAESPVRLLGEAVLRNWPTAMEAVVTPSGDMTSQELGLLFPKKGFNHRDCVPNRSGSAPPCIEGSCVLLNNDTGQHHPSPVGSMVRSTKNGKHGFEEQLRSDPSYVTFYSSNVNLNPRLPPPITSRETRHLAQHANQYNDGKAASFLSPMTSLPTHKEETSRDSNGNEERIMSGHFVSSLGQHTSLVELIQEDFPRTPSPVFSNAAVTPSHGPPEDRVNSDACAHPLQDASVTAGKTHNTSDRACSKNPDAHSDKYIRCHGSSDTKVPSQQASTKEGSDKSSNGSTRTSLVDANQGTVDTALQGLHIASENGGQNLRPNTLSTNSVPWGRPQQIHNLQSHGMGPAYNIANQFPQCQSKSPTTGIGTPLYPAAGYLTSGSPYLQQSGVFAPQCNLGGFNVNTTPFPPFMAGYPPQGTVPIGFEASTTVGFSGTNPNIAAIVDLHHLYKYYGQLGVVLQPSFSESLCMPYFPHPSLGAYGASVHCDHTSRSYDVKPPAYLPDQREMHLRGGNLNILSPIKVEIASPTNYGGPPNGGVLLQYPASALASPQLPGSPIAQPALPVRRPENIKLPVCSVQNAGAYSGWQVMRGHEKLGDPKTHSILEELKSNRARRFELSDVVGHIFEFSTDQHGSRFIQQKLETCSTEEKASVFSEVLPHASMLMTDVFGNYVIQKFFEYGNPEQRKELANQLVNRVLPLSLQMYGCRVIQKALEVVGLDQKTKLVLELDGHVMRCVRDQNGNHVIQKCIECVPTDRIIFIISAFCGQISTLSMHPYGCRVIQRVLEHCTDDDQIQLIVDEILQSACLLAQDQYGNYVIQHVLERGRPHERNQIISKLAGQVVEMSQHKFASNVVEKCLEHGDTAERECMIEEIVGETEGNDMLLIMMKDQFANYVVQKILETCNDKQREILLNRIGVHLQTLKRFTYGKHIVTRVEQLSGEESHIASE